MKYKRKVEYRKIKFHFEYKSDSCFFKETLLKSNTWGISTKGDGWTGEIIKFRCLDYEHPIILLNLTKNLPTYTKYTFKIGKVKKGYKT